MKIKVKKIKEHERQYENVKNKHKIKENKINATT